MLDVAGLVVDGGAFAGNAVAGRFRRQRRRLGHRDAECRRAPQTIGAASSWLPASRRPAPRCGRWAAVRCRRPVLSRQHPAAVCGNCRRDAVHRRARRGRGHGIAAFADSRGRGPHDARQPATNQTFWQRTQRTVRPAGSDGRGGELVVRRAVRADNLHRRSLCTPLTGPGRFAASRALAAKPSSRPLTDRKPSECRHDV